MGSTTNQDSAPARGATMEVKSIGNSLASVDGGNYSSSANLGQAGIQANEMWEGARNSGTRQRFAGFSARARRRHDAAWRESTSTSTSQNVMEPSTSSAILDGLIGNVEVADSHAHLVGIDLILTIRGRLWHLECGAWTRRCQWTCVGGSQARVLGLCWQRLSWKPGGKESISW